MRVFSRLLLACTFFPTATINAKNGISIMPVNNLIKAIYGDDTRQDLQSSNVLPWQAQMAKATAILVAKSSLSSQGMQVTRFGDFIWESEENSRKYSMCSDEPFYEQKRAAAGLCSGFLVAPDVLATAGHCLPDFDACAEMAFVFGFNVETKVTQNTAIISPKQVYFCKELIHSEISETDDGSIDFAIVKLDRMVNAITPLQVRLHGVLLKDENVTMIGYPVGLPLKVASGSVINDDLEATVQTDLDSFEGNSGSVVLNNKYPHYVEGILSHGAEDFVVDRKKRCFRSKRCLGKKCEGETVQRISSLLPYLN